MKFWGCRNRKKKRGKESPRWPEVEGYRRGEHGEAQKAGRAERLLKDRSVQYLLGGVCVLNKYRNPRSLSLQTPARPAIRAEAVVEFLFVEIKK